MRIIDFVKNVISNIKYKKNIKEEWNLCWHVMGLSLYYKYMTGTATEEDFF